MERRSQVRSEVRFDAVWAAGSLDGVGVLGTLSRMGAWIDCESAQPPVGARIRIAIIEEEQEPMVVDGAVVRRTSSGFALDLDAAYAAGVGAVLAQIEEAGPDRIESGVS